MPRFSAPNGARFFAPVVSTTYHFILIVIITTFLCLSVGSALVLKNNIKESPLSNLPEPGDYGAPGK